VEDTLRWLAKTNRRKVCDQHDRRTEGRTESGKMKHIEEVHKYHLHRSDRRKLGKAVRCPSEWVSSEKKQG
jgi:hypothetical protein